MPISRHAPAYGITFLITSGLSAHGVKRVLSIFGGDDYSPESLLLGIAFAATGISTACFALFFLHATCAASGRLITASWHADRKLFILACMIPAINVAGCLALPSFLLSKNWTAYLIMQMVAGNILCQLPPAHALIDWLVKMPILG